MSKVTKITVLLYSQRGTTLVLNPGLHRQVMSFSFGKKLNGQHKHANSLPPSCPEPKRNIYGILHFEYTYMSSLALSLDMNHEHVYLFAHSLSWACQLFDLLMSRSKDDYIDLYGFGYKFVCDNRKPNTCSKSHAQPILTTEESLDNLEWLSPAW